MKTVIVIHVLPHEIDWFEWQCRQLKQAAYQLSDDQEVIFDITLNTNLVDWNKSQLPISYFHSKLDNCVRLLDDKHYRVFITDNDVSLGIDDVRRAAIRQWTDVDNFIYLDCDLVFKPETLTLLLEGARIIPNEYYIISPQVTKLWDSTWDVLGNKHYQEAPYRYERIQDPFAILDFQGEPSVVSIPVFKFGGGWFNLLSSKLLYKTDIPDSFGPYGIDDTYVMYCCELMKQRGIDVQQYVLEDVIVAENYKYRDLNHYTDHLKIIDKKDEYRKAADDNMFIELEKFKNTL